jgi:hypothetical protein
LISAYQPGHGFLICCQVERKIVCPRRPTFLHDVSVQKLDKVFTRFCLTFHGNLSTTSAIFKAKKCSSTTSLFKKSTPKLQDRSHQKIIYAKAGTKTWPCLKLVHFYVKQIRPFKIKPSKIIDELIWNSSYIEMKWSNTYQHKPHPLQDWDLRSSQQMNQLGLYLRLYICRMDNQMHF